MLSGWDKIDAQKVVPFVRRYGLLWHGAEDLGTGRCRESLAKWQEEVAELALCINLFVILQESVEEGSAEPLRDAGIDPARIFKVKPSNDREFMGQMSVFLAEVMCDKLEDCTLGVTSSIALDVRPRGPSTFLLLQKPPNLTAAAYAQRALYIVNRAPIKECPGCGRMFIPESGKQKYHSPSCASTSRWRRWKEKQTN